MKPFRRVVSWGVAGLLILLSARATSEEPVRLTIQSEPSGAVVYLDGQQLEVTTPARVMVAPGSHNIRLMKPGYREVSRPVEVLGDGFVNFALESLASPTPPKPESQPTSTLTPSAAPAASQENPPPSSPAGGKHEPAEPPAAPPVPLPLENFLPSGSLPPSEKKNENRPAAEKQKPAPPPAPPVPAGGDSVEPAPAAAGAEEEEVPAAEPGAFPEGAKVNGMPPCQPKSPATEDAPTCLKTPEISWPDSAEGLMSRAAQQVPRFPERLNVLLLGLDRRDRYGILATGAEIPEDKLQKMGARSDVIMVIQLDFLEKQIRMVSIPRDTRVRIRGSMMKINSAYTYGREPLAKRVVENFFGITIHRVVTVDWRGAKKAIALFKSLGLDYNGFSEQELFWHLRKRSFQRGDFHRIERQQLFLRYGLGEYLRLYNEILETQGTAAMVKRGLLEMAIREGLSVVKTDFNFEELRILSYIFRDYDVRRMTLAQVHGAGEMAGDDSESKIYIFKPALRHSFNDIIARVEKGEK